MYLARREFGKILRVYPLKTRETPRAWPFNPVNYTGAELTKAALAAGSHSGIAATGHTRTEARANLALAEEAGIDQLAYIAEVVRA
jgi:hypothetical protein